MHLSTPSVTLTHIPERCHGCERLLKFSDKQLITHICWGALTGSEGEWRLPRLNLCAACVTAMCVRSCSTRTCMSHGRLESSKVSLPASKKAGFNAN
eukprot:2180776-Amphidinium_carterae.1